MIDLSYYYKFVSENVTAHRISDRRFGSILITIERVGGDFTACVDDIEEIADVLKAQGITVKLIRPEDRGY